MHRKIFLSLLLLALSSSVLGQKIVSHMINPMGSLADVRKGSFSSIEVGFSIDLPADTHGGGGNAGIEKNWRLNEGYFTVGIVERDHDIENGTDLEEETKKIVDLTYSGFARAYFETKAEILKVDKKMLEHEGHKGMEYRILLSDSVCLIRVFWVKNRAVKTAVLLAGKQGDYEPAATKVFNSLRLMTPQSITALILKKIQENTPAVLPQTPVAKKAKSDAADENLTGKIKVVFQESQFISGSQAGTARKKDSENYYNQAGNLTKSVRYSDVNGLPREITAYGYLKGFRVSKTNSIHFGERPPGIMIDIPTNVVAKMDDRYDTRYVYTYDVAGNMTQKVLYHIFDTNKSVFRRKGRIVEVLFYRSQKRIDGRWTTTYNEKGDPVEIADPDSPIEGWLSVYKFKYLEFDELGNWTKRTHTRAFGPGKRISDDWTMMEYRMITYY